MQESVGVFMKKFHKILARRGHPKVARSCVVGSVFVRQKKGRHAVVGFRDDPELHARTECVRGKQTPAVG